MAKETLISNSINLIISVLEAIAATNEHFIQASIKKRLERNVKKTISSTDIRNYQPTPMVAFYLDIERAIGDPVVWTLDISWEKDRIVIDRHVSVVDNIGQTTIKSFPTEYIDDASQFFTILDEAVKSLLEYPAPDPTGESSEMIN
jgi:hypothetical protein